MLGKWWENAPFRVIIPYVAKQKPPNSVGHWTGFPYADLWEEFGESSERLWDHGCDRDRIDRHFRMAREFGGTDLVLTKAQIRRIIEPLELQSSTSTKLAETLFYLAGHYYSPRFHKLFGDAPADARRLLKRIAWTATKLERLMSQMTDATERQVRAARLSMHGKRRSRFELERSDLMDEIADFASLAAIIADELPQMGRGTTEKVLQGRWLRHSAEAIELATGRTITAKVGDSAGANYRFEGTEGAVFQAYCTTVDKGLFAATLVKSVRLYHRHGLAGLPPKSAKGSI